MVELRAEADRCHPAITLRAAQVCSKICGWNMRNHSWRTWSACGRLPLKISRHSISISFVMRGGRRYDFWLGDRAGRNRRNEHRDLSTATWGAQQRYLDLCFRLLRQPASVPNDFRILMPLKLSAGDGEFQLHGEDAPHRSHCRRLSRCDGGSSSAHLLVYGHYNMQPLEPSWPGSRPL